VCESAGGREGGIRSWPDRPRSLRAMPGTGNGTTTDFYGQPREDEGGLDRGGRMGGEAAKDDRDKSQRKRGRRKTSRTVSGPDELHRRQQLLSRLEGWVTCNRCHISAYLDLRRPRCHFVIARGATAAQSGVNPNRMMVATAGGQKPSNRAPPPRSKGEL